LLITAGLGGLFGLIAGSVLSVGLSSSRHMLRDRDDVADAISAPVLASLRVRRPARAAGWTHLLDSYRPEGDDAAVLREILAGMGLGDLPSGPGAARAYRSLLVLSLSSDPRALAVGPQLAAFAASLGVPTALLVDDRHNARAMASLRSACAAGAGQSTSERGGHLQLGVMTEQAQQWPAGADLTIRVGVVDGKVPRLEGGDVPSAAVLAVSPGVASGEELARVAASITAEGLPIGGAIVANARTSDYSTGRVPQPVGTRHQSEPSHMGWMTTEIAQ
jgi:hypothetical protein